MINNIIITTSSSLSSKGARSCWTGLIQVQEFPTRLRLRGEICVQPLSVLQCCDCWGYLLQQVNPIRQLSRETVSEQNLVGFWYLSENGNLLSITSLNSCLLIFTSSNEISLAPRPALNSYLSATVEGFISGPCMTSRRICASNRCLIGSFGLEEIRNFLFDPFLAQCFPFFSDFV